jgi:hypothetical protein
MKDGQITPRVVAQRKALNEAWLALEAALFSLAPHAHTAEYDHETGFFRMPLGGAMSRAEIATAFRKLLDIAITADAVAQASLREEKDL